MIQRCDTYEPGTFYLARKDTAMADETLTPTAQAIWTYLMTLPPDWNIYKREIHSHFRIGINAFDAAWKLLQERGYITYSYEPNRIGNQYASKVWTAHEVPVTFTSDTKATNPVNSLQNQVPMLWESCDGNHSTTNNNRTNKEEEENPTPPEKEVAEERDELAKLYSLLSASGKTVPVSTITSAAVASVVSDDSIQSPNTGVRASRMDAEKRISTYMQLFALAYAGTSGEDYVPGPDDKQYASSLVDYTLQLAENDFKQALDIYNGLLTFAFENTESWYARDFQKKQCLDKLNHRKEQLLQDYSAPKQTDMNQQVSAIKMKELEELNRKEAVYKQQWEEKQQQKRENNI